jgi:hypothetical protein
MTTLVATKEAITASKARILETVQELCKEGISMTGCYEPAHMEEAREEFTIAAIMIKRLLGRMPAGELAVEWSRAARSYQRGQR